MTRVSKLGIRTRNWIAAGVLAVGGLFLLTGVIRGETAVVLRKAAKICLECIGIG